MRPRLRPHVQITRQHYRGRRWHVVHDPTSNQFYRLSPVAHEFVNLLDGTRTVEQVWQLSLETHGDGAPTQGEVVELLSQLYNSNLLAGDAPPETEQLLRRGRERRKRKAAQQALGIMYFRMRLFNPDWLLTHIEPVLRPLLNRWGLLLWALWVLAGLSVLIRHWSEFTSTFADTIAPGNWGWLIVVFIVTKAIHETGHGVICKRFGGLVPEFGVMLLVLFPAPYVDASACWAFPSKWKRMAVGAGGMIFELAVASAAAMVWASAADGSTIRQIAYNAIFVASISTILFNANPLMRFDGYYILSDLLEIPNLMQRSMKLIQHHFKRRLFGLKHDRPPTTVPSEAAIMLVYGVLALAYRVFLFITITLYVMGVVFGVGLILAIWTAAAWFCIPAGKFIHYLASSPQLHDHRARAILTSTALAGALVVLVGFVPMPNHRRAQGVVESLQQTGVFAANHGFVSHVHVRLGDRVRAGDPIISCESPDLQAQIDMFEAELEAAEARWRYAQHHEPVAAPVARDKVVTIRNTIDKLRDRRDRLVVRAPHDGIIVGDDPARLAGAFVQQGQPVCEIVDADRLRVQASLTSLVARPIIERIRAGEPLHVEVRRFSDADHSILAASATLIDAGSRRLPHPALGYAGGGSIPTEQDESGMAAREHLFPMHITAPEGVSLGFPGERVAVRFTLPPRPLLVQWGNRLYRMIQERIDI